MRQIISIGRQFGSGGREIGRKLAQELGYNFYDREILRRRPKS
jgi:shikimate kinase